MNAFRWAVAVLALGLPGQLVAQQPWAAAASPTTQTLWGATDGNNQFVAVGEGGAILTSPDGVAWTLRSSGTTSFVAMLRRFHSDGRPDSGIAAREFMTGSTRHVTGSLTCFSGPRIISARDAQNLVYLGVQFGDRGGVSLAINSGTTRLFRLMADGVPDASYTPRDVGPLFALVATPAGLIARTTTEHFVRLQGTATLTDLLRLKFDGTPDPAFHAKSALTHRGSSHTVPVGLGYDYNVLAVLPDGRILVRTVGHLGRLGIIRLTANGDLDSNFNTELGSDASAVSQLHGLPDGRLLVAGTFRSLLGVVQPYLARLTPNTRAATTHLGNLSVRARAGTGVDTLITGDNTRNVLLRAVGPALAPFGISDSLPDPVLILYRDGRAAATNDDWALNTTIPLHHIALLRGSLQNAQRHLLGDTRSVRHPGSPMKTARIL